MVLNLAGLGDSTTGLDTTGGISTTPGVLMGVPPGFVNNCDPTSQDCSVVQGIFDPSIPCMPLGASGPLQPGQAYCPVDPGTQPILGSGIPCMPPGAVGPLQPGQVYCATGTGSPAGSGATSMNWMILVAVLGGLVLISSGGGRR